MVTVTQIHGIDFSGAEDAGRRIWISSGVIHAGRLRITQSRPACELPGGSPRREATFDGSADAFRETCRALLARELRRATDRQAHAPWAAWNWRLYRQTYYGIRSVLAPLVRDDRLRVLPMDVPDGTRPLLLEICPASTLRRLGLGGLPYKGGASRDKRAARRQILDCLVGGRRITPDPRPFERAVEHPGGDAIDSIIAATAVFQVIASQPLTPDGLYDPIEGFIYL